MAGFSNAFLLFDLPFLFNDAAHARRVIDGPIGDQVAKTLEPHGIKVLAYNESGFRMMFNSKFYEQAKFMALTRHTYTPTPFIANLKFLQDLSPGDQRIVTQAARDAAAAQRALIDRRTSEFIDLLKKEGVKVTEVDTLAFRARAAPVHKEYEAKIGKELLDAVLKKK